MIDSSLTDAAKPQQAFDAALKRYQAVEHRVAAERRCPSPDAASLQALWRERQRLRGELARFGGSCTHYRGRA